MVIQAKAHKELAEDMRLYGTDACNTTLVDLAKINPKTISSLAGPMAQVADFTYCPGCSGCGGGQCCNDQMEFAMSDGPYWRSQGQPAMSGGCGQPDCDCCTNPQCGCAGPSCSHGWMWGKTFRICYGSNCVNGQLGGCCPSNHPCNIAKAEGQCGGGGPAGYCRNDRDHIDACPNLRAALGYPPSGGQVTFEKIDENEFVNTAEQSPRVVV